MSPRWVDPLLVVLVALVARVAVAAAIPFAVPEDTAYYVGVARNLVEGRGLVTDAIWSYATPPLVLPRPAFELWRPLPSLLVALPMALLGPEYRVAQLVPLLAGVVVALLGWRIGVEVAADLRLPPGRTRGVALATGLASAVSLPLLLHSGLPDSTMLFAALTLGACLLMARLLREGPAGPREAPALVGLGLLLGVASLARNEALWLGLVWAWLVLREPSRGAAGPWPRRLHRLAVPAATALVVAIPWALRDLAVFGTPLPGQALSNALFVSPSDVFAWSEPPSLARLLATGPAAIVGSRLEGLRHDLVDVLLLPGLPSGLLGLVALPWLRRRSGPTSVVRPLLLFGLLLFGLDSLVFAVATTQGTFLHAAGALHLLAIVGAVALVDAGSARLAARTGGPVRQGLWLGLLLVLTALMATSIATFGATADAIEARYERLETRLRASGVATGPGAPPILSDHPIWLAETTRTGALALPDEPPASVLSLARRFGATHLVASPLGGADAPAFLASGGPGAECFVPVDGAAAPAVEGDPRIWRIDCR